MDRFPGEVIVLDVGHGNTAIIKQDATCLVVDAPLGPGIVEALEHEQSTHVQLAIASHSDADHFGGLISLLLAPQIAVSEVRCNPDAMRRSDFWGDFKVAFRKARERHGTRLRTELTVESTPDLRFGDLWIEVVFPPAELALSGVGGLDEAGAPISPNTMSAVLRVGWQEEALAILTGDLDSTGLEWLVSQDCDLAAPTLVFPHHGGFPGGPRDDVALRAFARTLTERVGPQTVIYSFGRLKFLNPQPAIVAGVRDADPRAHIACTQLSQRCSDHLLPTGHHLSDRYAAGRQRGLCCAGTLVFGPAGTQTPARADHEAVIANLPGRLCR